MPDLTNMQKYANYKEQMERLNRAMKEHFFLEAMFIEYAVMEDRCCKRNRGRFSVLTEKQRKTYNVPGDEYGENSKSSGRQQDISCDASWNQPAKDLRRR